MCRYYRREKEERRIYTESGNIRVNIQKLLDDYQDKVKWFILNVKHHITPKGIRELDRTREQWMPFYQVFKKKLSKSRWAHFLKDLKTLQIAKHLLVSVKDPWKKENDAVFTEDGEIIARVYAYTQMKNGIMFNLSFNQFIEDISEQITIANTYSIFMENVKFLSMLIYVLLENPRVPREFISKILVNKTTNNLGRNDGINKDMDLIMMNNYLEFDPGRSIWENLFTEAELQIPLMENLYRFTNRITIEATDTQRTFYTDAYTNANLVFIPPVDENGEQSGAMEPIEDDESKSFFKFATKEGLFGLSHLDFVPIKLKFPTPFYEVFNDEEVVKTLFRPRTFIPFNLYIFKMFRNRPYAQYETRLGEIYNNPIKYATLFNRFMYTIKRRIWMKLKINMKEINSKNIISFQHLLKKKFEEPDNHEGPRIYSRMGEGIRGNTNMTYVERAIEEHGETWEGLQKVAKIIENN